MKRTIGMIFGAAAAALVFAPAAWAGSAASVNQMGDGGFALVIQKDGKPTRAATASNPGMQYMLQKKARAAAKQATRPRYARGGKMGGGSSYCNPGAGSNITFAGQNGIGNGAVVNQKGANNAAGVFQDGNGNKSHIVQKGTGHLAQTVQGGNNNTAYVIQKC